MVAKGNFGRVKDSVSFGPGSSRRRIILLEGQEIVARSKEILVTKEREGLVSHHRQDLQGMCT